MSPILMKKGKKYLFISMFLMVIAFIFFSCRKDPKFITDSAAVLNFSTDTVMFDTVFTTIGSSTRKLMVYNPHKDPIKISKIALAGGSSSPYMINIDGEYTTELYNKEISAKDSIYIFVKVRIDPLNSNNPLFVEDVIVFETNGNIQDVKLIACGQDAHYILPDIFGENFNYRKVEGVWRNDKPYVIYGYAVVDSAMTLVIEEGCELYFHKGGRLWVYEGTLHIKGSVHNKVTLQSDRREEYFKNLPGQWDGIIFQNSTNNIIENVVIRNAIQGIQCDGFAETSNVPTLQIINTKIENMKVGGIAGNGTSIAGANILIDQCYEYAMALCGGQFIFQHLTIGNFTSTDEAPSLLLQNYFSQYELVGDNVVERKITVTPTDIVLDNSIVWGNAQEEIIVAKTQEGEFNWSMNHCLLKTKRNLNESNFTECLANENPLFIKYEEYDYKLDTLSPALQRGMPLPNIAIDIDGNPRNPNNPDLGTYEMNY